MKQKTKKHIGMTFIYALVNLDTKEFFYVGQSLSPQSRFIEHITKTYVPKMRQYIKKNKNIGFVLLEIVPIEIAPEIEKDWYNELNKKYELINAMGQSFTNRHNNKFYKS